MVSSGFPLVPLEGLGRPLPLPLRLECHAVAPDADTRASRLDIELTREMPRQPRVKEEPILRHGPETEFVRIRLPKIAAAFRPRTPTSRVVHTAVFILPAVRHPRWIRGFGRNDPLLPIGTVVPRVMAFTV